MKLVHLKMKRPEADVSLSDGELFMVKRAPYGTHLRNAPDKQPVRMIHDFIDLEDNIREEIEMQQSQGTE
jgi:hypothetical protein